MAIINLPLPDAPLTTQCGCLDAIPIQLCSESFTLYTLHPLEEVVIELHNIPTGLVFSQTVTADIDGYVIIDLTLWGVENFTQFSGTYNLYASIANVSIDFTVGNVSAPCLWVNFVKVIE